MWGLAGARIIGDPRWPNHDEPLEDSLDLITHREGFALEHLLEGAPRSRRRACRGSRRVMAWVTLEAGVFIAVERRERRVP